MTENGKGNHGKATNAYAYNAVFEYAEFLRDVAGYPPEKVCEEIRRTAQSVVAQFAQTAKKKTKRTQPPAVSVMTENTEQENIGQLSCEKCKTIRAQDPLAEFPDYKAKIEQAAIKGVLDQIDDWISTEYYKRLQGNGLIDEYGGLVNFIKKTLPQQFGAKSKRSENI